MVREHPDTTVAAERVAARSAITRLNLTPTMFETGAGPYPPRQL